MKVLEPARHPTGEPGFGSFCVLAGMCIGGLQIGQLWFASKTGIAVEHSVAPWWFSLLFAVGASTWAYVVQERLFRIALILIAAINILSAANAFSFGQSLELVRAGLRVAWAFALAAAGW